MHRRRRDVVAADELRRGEEERQELVVVEAPDAVRAGGLEPVRRLHLAHQQQVAAEDARHHRRPVGRLEQLRLLEPEQPREEREPVPRAVVDPRRVAEGVGEVRRELAPSAAARASATRPLRSWRLASALGDARAPRLERLVAVAHRLLQRTPSATSPVAAGASTMSGTAGLGGAGAADSRMPTTASAYCCSAPVIRAYAGSLPLAASRDAICFDIDGGSGATEAPTGRRPVEG